MKNIFFAFGLIIFNLLILSPSCTEAVSDNDLSISQKLMTLSPVDAHIPDDFMRGFDASSVIQLEEKGAVFRGIDGNESDIFSLLKSNGVNWIRLRIWNNPDEAIPGANNLTRTVKAAKRIKRSGLKLLLDFHYSDTWADTGKQKIPAAWSNLGSVDDIKKSLADFTKSVLEALEDAGAAPDMVQIGNEIDQGLFISGVNNTALQGDISLHQANLAAYLNTASAAVRKKCPQAKIMIHLARGGDSDFVKWWFNHFAGNAPSVAAVDFDMIGLSYYPFYESHKSLKNLKKCISECRTLYGKPVTVVETSFAWTAQGADFTNNEFWHGAEAAAYNAFKDSAQIKKLDIYELKDKALEGQPFYGRKAIRASIKNQAEVVRAVIEVSAQAGSSGVFYWGGDWISLSELGSTWENQTFFDFDGKLLPSAGVFNVAGK
ncbi:MAG: glycoside hydrolase family 53 protein [Treponema sp.]